MCSKHAFVSMHDALLQSMQHTSIAHFSIELMWHDSVCVKSDPAENKLKHHLLHFIHRGGVLTIELSQQSITCLV